MRMRQRIVVLLIIATLVLGSIVAFAMKGNETEANYVRWLFFNKLRFFFESPLKFAFGDGSRSESSSAMMYGLVGVGAIVVMLIILKMFRDGESMALRRRLTDLNSAKSEAESLLQEEVWKGKHERQAKDSITKDLESSIERIEILLRQLGEKDKLLKTRESELHVLKATANSGQQAADPAGQGSDRELREELRRKSQLLQTRDGAVRELEQRLSARSTLWESQIREKDGLLKGRETELLGLRADVEDFKARLGETEAAKKRAEDLLQEEISKKRELLEASDIASKNEEQRLGEKIRVLDGQLTEKDKLLKGRDSEIASVRQQLEIITAAKEQSEVALQEQHGLKLRVEQTKDTAVKELEQRLGATIQALKTEAGEKDLLLQVKDGEIKSLKSEVKSITARLSELAVTRERSEAARETAHRELAERYAEEVKTLAIQLREKDEFLQARDGELQALKAEVKTGANQLDEVATLTSKVSSLTNELKAAGSSTQQSAQRLQDEVRRKSAQLEESQAAAKTLEQRFTEKLHVFESQVGEYRRQVAERDGELAKLTAKVTSLTAQLSDTGASKDQTTRSLQDELKQKSEQLRANESAQKALQASLAGKVRSLESQLEEKQTLIAQRDSDLDALTAKVSALASQVGELESARGRSERSLQEEVREKSALLEAKDSEVRELAERFKSGMKTVERQVDEKQKILEASGVEVSELRVQIHALTERLSESEKTRSWLEGTLAEARQKESQALMAIEKNGSAANGDMDGLDDLILDREEVLKARDHLIQNLMTELKDKKTQLARHEIEVWKGIERRGVWKNRLSKIGIRMKE